MEKNITIALRPYWDTELAGMHAFELGMLYFHLNNGHPIFYTVRNKGIFPSKQNDWIKNGKHKVAVTRAVICMFTFWHRTPSFRCLTGTIHYFDGRESQRHFSSVWLKKKEISPTFFCVWPHLINEKGELFWGRVMIQKDIFGPNNLAKNFLPLRRSRLQLRGLQN